MTLRVQAADLVNVRDGFGLPDTAMTGDLNDTTTPTEELLNIYFADIGSKEMHVYGIGNGPKGPRRYDFPRCVLATPPRMILASNQHQVIETVFDIIDPVDAAAPYQISDQP